MISKQALKEICNKCEEGKVKRGIRCPFRSISNDYCEEYETIEKELKELERIKENTNRRKDRRTMKYLVVNFEDEEFGAFDTRTEAKEHIKELKRFDKENGNPFDEGYRVLLINDNNEPVCYCP